MFVFSPKIYDFLKRLVQVILPALSSAYFALANIWEWGGAEKVCGTIAVITTALGLCLGISSKTYNALNAGTDGTFGMHEDDDGALKFKLTLDADPEDLVGKDEIKFKLDKRPLKAVSDAE